MKATQAGFGRWFFVPLVLLLLVLGAAGPARGAATATVSGTVTLASDGSPLPGVSVTARDDERGVAGTAVSDGAGAFRIPLLRPSTYTISAELAGFSAWRSTGMQLVVGQEAVLQIRMQAAATAEVAVSAGAEFIDPTSSQVSSNVTPLQVKTLPLATRNYLELALLAPGTTPGRDLAFTGVVSGGAQEARWTFVSLDGADNNNFIVGGQQANVSQDSVQEFQVLTNNFSAEYGRSNSIVVNVVTKSGTNDFHGSGYDYFRSASLAADPFFDGVASRPSRRQNWGGTLGGSLVRDKAFFFGSFDKLDNESPTTVNIAVRPDLNQTVAQETTRKLAFGKIDLTPSQAHHLTLSYRYDDRDQTNLGVGGSAAASYGYAQKTISKGAILSHQWAQSSSTYNEAKLTYLNFDQNSPPNSTLPGQSHPSYSLGGNPRFPQGGTETRYGIGDTFSKAFGNHFVKVGADFSRWKGDLYFVLFSSGQYIFRSDSPTAAPFVFAGGSGNPTFKNYISFWDAFIQDEWRVNQRLTINLGVRYDLQDGAADSKHVSPFGIQPAKEDYNNVAPRVGFAYDVSGTGKTVVRGGGGIFYFELFNNLSLNENLNDGDRFKVAIFPCFAAPAACTDLTKSPTASIPQPPGLRLNSPDLVTPYTLSYSLGVATQLAPHLSVSADGVLTLGRHELAEFRENLKVDPANINSPRPDPRIAGIRSVHSAANSEYYGILTSLRKAFSDNWQAQVSYTFSHAINESEFFAVAVSDSRAAEPLKLDRGPARTDQRHRLVLNSSYSFPWGINVGTIVTVASGQPYSAYAGTDINNDDAPPFGQDRPPGFGRNSMLSKNYFRWDLRLSKVFVVGPASIELIGECFNLTNTPNYDPNTYNNLAPPDIAGTAVLPPRYSAGYVPPASFGSARPSTADAYQSRQFQLAARVSF